jgi:hypothetical protein
MAWQTSTVSADIILEKTFAINYFHLKSFSCVTEIERTDHENGESHGKKQGQISVIYRSKDNLFYTDIQDRISIKNYLGFSGKYSFNGKLSQYLEDQSKTLFLKSEDSHKRIFPLAMTLGLFRCFAFADPNDARWLSYVPRAADVTTTNFWEQYFKSVQPESVVWEGMVCRVLNFKSITDLAPKQEIAVTIFLSEKDQFHPVGWEKRSLDGRLISSYKVHEFGKETVAGKVFIYPLKASESYFDRQGRLGTRMDYAVRDLILDTDMDDWDFDIDTGLANTIVDLDQKVRVSIPK